MLFGAEARSSDTLLARVHFQVPWSKHEEHSNATFPRQPPVASQLALPLEQLTVRIPVAIETTGIGRSKLYELIAAGELNIVKIGASTLITVTSLRRLIQKSRR